MDFKKQISSIASKLDEQSELLLNEELENARNISPIVENFVESIISISQGGKRLRGSMAYYCYLMLGGKNFEQMVKVSTFIELFSLYLLVHDDIIDDSDLRHHVPTIHAQYKKILPKATPIFSIGMAICAGDWLNHLAQKVFSESTFRDKDKIEAMNFFNSEMLKVAYGEVMDVWEVYLDFKTVDEDYIEKVNYLKTATYTFIIPLKLGAILANAPEKDWKTLAIFAKLAGIAFQVHDDILGMFGEAETIGKSADSDLKEGKKTLLILRALQEGNKEQSRTILDVLGNPKITRADLESVREIIVKTGSLDFSRQVVRDSLSRAKDVLLKNRQDYWVEEGMSFFLGLINFLESRKF